jgi:hypothetical protein
VDVSTVPIGDVSHLVLKRKRPPTEAALLRKKQKHQHSYQT